MASQPQDNPTEPVATSLIVESRLAASEPTAGGASGGGEEERDRADGPSGGENVQDSTSSPAEPTADDSTPSAPSQPTLATDPTPPSATESTPAAQPASPAPPPSGSAPAESQLKPDLDTADTSAPSTTDAASAVAGSLGAPAAVDGVGGVPSPVPSPSPRPASTSSATQSSAPPAVKKFVAVSVNKKFLSATPASTAASTTDKASPAATKLNPNSKLPPLLPPTNPPSRLLTTKLVHPTPRAAAPPPAPSGWARPTPSPGATHKPSSLELGMGGSAPKPRSGSNSFSWGPGPGGDKRRPLGGGPGGRMNDFPTTAESAEGKAAALANAQASKQALAERNQAMILELDAFRGVHLDPNAHHWDDDDEENDNFLDDVVEFGDGTTYTVDHNEPPPPDEPPSDQRSGPPQDYDRSWPQKQGGPPPPHQSQSSQRVPPAQQRHSFQHSTSPIADTHLHSARGPSSSQMPIKPRAGEDPSRVLFNDRTSRFETPGPGRGPPAGPGGLGPAGAGGMQRRRPSNDRPPPMRGSSGFDRPPPPHVELQRSLPPHLEGRAAPPSAPAHVPQPAPPPARNAWGVARTAAPPVATSPTAVLKDFPPPSALGANRAPLPPQSNAFATAGALPPPARSGRLGSFSKPVDSLAPPVKSPEVATQALPHPSLALRRISTGVAAPVPLPKEDVTLMQKDEMHSAAERARLRRQKEEEERMQAAERARAKAKELEEKYKPKTEEKRVEPVVPAPVVAPISTPKPPPSAPPSAPAAQRPPPPAAAQAQPKTILVAPRNLDRGPVTPVRAQPVQKWKLDGNLLPATGFPTPPPPQLNKGEPVPDDVQVVDFSDLGSLMAPTAPAPAPPQPTKTTTRSRRPVATDFFEPTPPSPSRPTPSSAAAAGAVNPPAKAEATPSAPSMAKSPSLSLPARPARKESSPSGPVLPPPMPSSPSVERHNHGAPLSPSKSTHRPVQASQFDDAMARIKGLMRHEGGSTSPPSLSAPSSPTKKSRSAPPMPIEPFDPHTKPDRPASPVGWKVYTVKLPPSPLQKKRPVEARQMKQFNRTDAFKVVDPVSWEPPLGRTQKERLASRDEMLLPRKVQKNGQLAPPEVSLPGRKGWETLKNQPSLKSTKTSKTPVPSPPSSKVATPQPGPTPTPTPKAIPTSIPSAPSSAPVLASPVPQLNVSAAATTAPPVVAPPASLVSPPSVPSPSVSPTTALPTRPVPTGAVVNVVPPTPMRPVRPGRAMEESTWRRRTPVPETTPVAGLAQSVGQLTLEPTKVAAPTQVAQPIPVPAQVPAVPNLQKVIEPANTQLKLPEGADIYRDRSPSVGTASEEQLAPLVRFMVTSDVDSFLPEELGPRSTNPGVEDVPEFASIMRSPSSSGGDLSRTESSTSVPRLPNNVAGVVLSPPSAATSSAWSNAASRVDREQQVRDVWAQSSPSLSAADGSSQSTSGPFPSGLHFSSPDLQGHPNPNGRFAAGPPQSSPFAPAPRNNSFGQALPPAQGFSSPYGSASRLPNGNGTSQPNSPGVYASSFGSSPHLPNPSAPAFSPAQMGRSPSMGGASQTGGAQAHRSAYNPYGSSTNGSSNQGYPTGPGSLNPASQPFTMRPNSLSTHQGAASPASHGAQSLPPPPHGTTQGVWLPVVPMPSPQPTQNHNPTQRTPPSSTSSSSYNPYSQQRQAGGYGLPSPNQTSFPSPLPPPSQASPYNNANLPNQNHFSNPNPAKPYRSNLSDFSTAAGRQPPPHQSGGGASGGSGMFSNGRAGPMDQARERERERERERQVPPHQQQQQQQPVFASIGGAFVPQNGAGGNAGGGAGGAYAGGARRTGW